MKVSLFRTSKNSKTPALKKRKLLLMKLQDKSSSAGEQQLQRRQLTRKCKTKTKLPNKRPKTKQLKKLQRRQEKAKENDHLSYLNPCIIASLNI